MAIRLAITMGDPAGVGAEVALKALAQGGCPCEPVLIGPRSVWKAAAETFDLPLPRDIENIGDETAVYPRGVVDAACGRAAYEALMRAIELALAGEVDGIVTAPLNKASLHRAGIAESGHTEILARETAASRHALMLYSPRIACAFVTCHQSLASVPGSLTIEHVVDTVELLHNTLKFIRGMKNHIAMLGLNPHAGEEGIFGDEEKTILIPAVHELRSRGIEISDPLPPDTAFTPEALKRFDGHVCLYHDQGAIPFKMLSFDDGVNVTLGLPIVRTSPDHGTAFDIAWQGRANPSSMAAAIELAARL